MAGSAGKGSRQSSLLSTEADALPICAFLGQKCAPQHRLRFHRREVVGSHQKSVEVLGSLHAAQVSVPPTVCCDVIEDVVLLLPIEKICRRDFVSVEADTWHTLPKSDESGGLRELQRPKHQRVHHAENIRVRTDAQREREDGNSSKAGALAQHSQSETDILEQLDRKRTRL